jgi:quercetin dioxygenase-like cupin family protein
MSDFTHLNLLDVEDLAPQFGMSAMGEARFARDALGCTKSGLSHQTLVPGARQPFGHRHTAEEEIYLVLSGSGSLRLDDEVVDIVALDAIRVAPSVMRAFEAGPEGLEVVAFGAPGLGGPDADMVPGWWESEGGAVA